MGKVAPDRAGSAADGALSAIAHTARGSRQTVEEMAQRFIREAIRQGAFPPGHRLNVDNIAAALGISRMPVRASFRQLETEGLLRVHPYRGATVSVLRADEIAEIYEMRILLETYLLDRAIVRLDDVVVDRLAGMIHSLEVGPSLGYRVDRRRCFYDLLYAQAERPRALEQANQLRLVGRYLLLQRTEHHGGHETLMGYLRERDADAAKAWLVTHFTNVSETLQAMVLAELDKEAG